MPTRTHSVSVPPTEALLETPAGAGAGPAGVGPTWAGAEDNATELGTGPAQVGTGPMDVRRSVSGVPRPAPPDAGAVPRRTGLLRLGQLLFAAFCLASALILSLRDEGVFAALQTAGAVGYALAAPVLLGCAWALGRHPLGQADLAARARTVLIVFHLAFVPLQFLFSFGNFEPLAGMVVSTVFLVLLRPRFPQLRRRTRKIWLAVHIGTSVSWLGLSLAMTVMAVAGLTADTHAVRHGAYELMHLFDLALVIPSMALALASGVVISLGTPWGLVKHWWVLVKLVIALSLPTFAAFVESKWIRELQKLTQDPAADPGGTGLALVVCLATFTVLLWTAVILSVFKPGGRTAMGRRAERRRRAERTATPDRTTGNSTSPRATDRPDQAPRATDRPDQAPRATTPRATDRTGQAIDSTGQAADSTGQAIDSTGQATDRTAQAADRTRQAADPTSQAADPTSQGVAPTRQIIDPTSRANSPEEPARSGWTPVVVGEVRELAEGVVSLELWRAERGQLPGWQPGAHVDLALPSGKVRQFSLFGDPDASDATDVYRIAVLLEPDGRGGSAEVHALRPGAAVEIRGPRNNFPLVEAPSYLFLAGGIGITPFLPMIRRLDAEGADWRLFHRGRTRSAMAFAEELVGQYPGRVRVAASDTHPRASLHGLLSATGKGVAVYCCGPDSMVRAVAEAMPESCPHGQLYVERFTPGDRPDPALDQPFEAELRRSGTVVRVGADASLLTALRDVEPTLDFSCTDGICGSCETRVLDGTPDHRDDVLQAHERDRRDVIYPCVSRALGHRITLDL